MATLSEEANCGHIVSTGKLEQVVTNGKRIKGRQGEMIHESVVMVWKCVGAQIDHAVGDHKMLRSMVELPH